MEASCGYLFNSSAIDYANSSNSSATEYVNLTYSCTAFLLPGCTPFHIVMSIALAAVIIFNGLIAVVLLRATSVAVTVRVPLINLLVAALIAAVMLLCGTLSSVVLAQGGSTVLLEVLLVVSPYLLGGSPNGFAEIASQLGLVVFSVVVFRTVRRGTTTIRAKWLIFSLVITWVIAILTTITMYTPIIYTLPLSCNEIHIFSIALAIIAAAICITFAPLLVCICVIVGTLCYIKRHTISEGAQYKKAMAKFAAFLITGNVLNVLDHFAHIVVTPGLLFANVPFLYLTYIITLLSFIPTPILIVVFLKPVRKGLRCLFCNKYRRDNETIPMQQAETPL